MSTESLDNLPPNTFCIGNNYETVNLTTLKALVPLKIRNRLALNEMGLNGLATVIVPPDCRDVLTPEGLEIISKMCNRVNSKIGLPHSNDLIIRTSSESFKSPIQNKTSPAFSEPALLAKNVSGQVKYEVLGVNRRDVPTLSDFLHALPERAFIIIHDDNYSLQMNALHGRIYSNGDNIEVVLATKTLHSRNLGEGNPNYPFIAINSDNFDNIEAIDPAKSASTLGCKNEIETRRLKARALNCDEASAFSLLKRFKTDYGFFMLAHKTLERRFGQRCVTEFRDYILPQGGLGQKIHVLDFNLGFRS